MVLVLWVAVVCTFIWMVSGVRFDIAGVYLSANSSHVPVSVFPPQDDFQLHFDQELASVPFLV